MKPIQGGIFVIKTDAFSNKELLSDTLETPADMSFEALSPDYRKMLLVSTSIVVASIIILNVAINLLVSGSLQSLLTGVGAIIASGFMILVALLGLALPKLIWRSKGYQLREHDVHFRRGIVWRHVTSLPYVRVQHVELESGPIERYFKLATLKFYTAGGGSADMTVPGLPFATASKIRTYIMKRAGVGGDDNSLSAEAKIGTEQQQNTPTL